MFPMTAHGLNQLQKELRHLMTVERPKIIEEIARARQYGDLSENAEYHQTREDQGKLEGRIAKIEQILRSSQVVSQSGGDIVEVGSKVVVEKDGSKEKQTYLVVGSEEADMALGKISNRSPFGVAIFGKKKGDKISFKTPAGGVVNYKIISVS